MKHSDALPICVVCEERARWLVTYSPSGWALLCDQHREEAERREPERGRHSRAYWLWRLDAATAGDVTIQEVQRA